jgi:hypothetical protein
LIWLFMSNNTEAVMYIDTLTNVTMEQ